MSDADSVHGQIRAAYYSAEKILIASHIRPDGDAIGSVLGLGLALQALGKQVDMVMVDGVPRNLRHLEGSRQVRREARPPYDLLISVDASDPARLGVALNGMSPDINIDHHVTNLLFGRINLVEAETVATAAIIASHLNEWGLPLSQPVAEALLTGIVTDTIGFRTSNMNPDALRISAALMEAGANLPELYLRALVYRSFSEAQYWGKGLARLQREDGMIWTELTLADRTAVGYGGADDADLNNMLSSIEDGHISVLFIEQKDGSVKVSWRARPGIDVSQIAFRFGGGGHPAASGADIPGSLEEVRPLVLQETQKLLNFNG